MRLPALPAAFPVAVLLTALLPCATTGCKKPGGASTDGGTDGALASAEAGASLAFLSGFEGEIDGFIKDSTKAGAQPVNVAVLVKGGKLKADIPESVAKGGPGNPFGDKGYVIFDSAAKKLTAVMDAKKEAVVIDLNSSKALSGIAPPAAPGHPGSTATPSKITKTGKTDTVAGYPCEYWDLTSDHKEGSVCMGSDGPSWFTLPTSGIPAAQAWMGDLLDGKHFPLRFIGYAKDGTTEENRIEVTKIDKKSVDDSVFQVPAGYKTIDLEKMMGGLGSMPGLPVMPVAPGGGPPGPGHMVLPGHH